MSKYALFYVSVATCQMAHMIMSSAHVSLPSTDIVIPMNMSMIPMVTALHECHRQAEVTRPPWRCALCSRCREDCGRPVVSREGRKLRRRRDSKEEALFELPHLTLTMGDSTKSMKKKPTKLEGLRNNFMFRLVFRDLFFSRSAYLGIHS